MKIRPGTEEDFEDIIALIAEFAAFEKASDKMKNSVARMQEEKDHFNFFVVENEAKLIVGYVSYFICYFTWIGKSLYMDDLYIQPPYREKGLGTQLLNTIFDFAKEANCHKVRWQVSNWNTPAIEFYKKIGAEISDIENNCDYFPT